MNPVKRIIGYGSFPYVSARVRTMRSNLLTSNDYRKLEKMSTAEILEFLQQCDYKQDINRFSSEYDREDLLELALRNHKARVYSKLLDMSPEILQDLLRAYFQRIDLENVKTVLRSKRRGHDDIEDMLLPTQDLPEERLLELADMERMEDLLAAIKLPGGDQLLDRAEPDDDLQTIEREIDRAYYEHLINVADEIPEQGQLFRRFLQLEVESRNLSMILRLKRAGRNPEYIRDQLFDLPHTVRTVSHDDLIRAESYEDAIELLKDEKIGSYIGSDNLAEVERALDRYKLEQGSTMLHQQPLSINPVLGYMIAKEAEIQNLRVILQANKADLGEEFMERNIIHEVVER
ncbi:MAG: V-type ATPase subunit [Candidatus Nanohaloarchaea archaeon]|nr:V-type ATPase subunit [Candidatus Nanohaloarchaea archaeon]